MRLEAPADEEALGSGIKLEPEVRRSAYQGSEAAKWKLEARYMVRGHYRLQPCSYEVGT